MQISTRVNFVVSEAGSIFGNVFEHLEECLRDHDAKRSEAASNMSYTFVSGPNFFLPAHHDERRRHRDLGIDRRTSTEPAAAAFIIELDRVWDPAGRRSYGTREIGARADPDPHSITSAYRQIDAYRRIGGAA